MRQLAILFLLVLGLAAGACGGGGGPAALGARDLDGDGILDTVDGDLDGDGRRNQFDDDVDGDGIPNDADADADEDGIPNHADDTPYGPWLPASQTLFVTSGVATVGFGDVPEGQLAGPAIITIENDTVSSVQIASVELAGTGAGAFTIDTTSLPGSGSFTLAPGGTATFTATFRPQAGTPALGRVLVDFRIGGQSAHGVVHLLGQGNAPALLASGAPSTINFGDVPVGITAGPGVATLRNDTATTYTVTRLELTGTGGGTFALDLERLPDATVPFPISPGETQRFHVTFTPRQGVPSIGEVSLDLTGGTTTRTLALDLLGQGIAGAMRILPESADAGAILAGVETSDTEVRIRNEAYANGPLTIDTIAFDEDADGAWQLVGAPALPATLAPGGPDLVLTARFQPAAAARGPQPASLRITGNDPQVTIDAGVVLEGYAAGWQAPATALPADARPADVPAPIWLAGSNRFVVRDAGPDGLWGGLVAPDDELIVVHADPDDDAESADARIVVRWGGLRLSSTASGAPVDAGDGRHVFFVGPGLDAMLGTADDQIHVLDTVGGSLRSLACPNAGAWKSQPVIVDANRGVVVVATGVDGGILASADTLLVYENLLGNLSASAPDQTVGLGTIVPDLACSLPVVIGTHTVVMPVADGSDQPDLDDRSLDDGNEGIVIVRRLGTGAAVEHLGLERALARTPAPAPGDGFCRAVAIGDAACLVLTAGADATDDGDDLLVRLDGIDGATPTLAATAAMPRADGLAARPVPVSEDRYASASAGPDGLFGTNDDMLVRIETDVDLTVEAFAAGFLLAGDGGATTRPLASGEGVLVPSMGPDGVSGSGDDALMHVALDGSILATLPVPGGLFHGDRSSTQTLAAPRPIDDRFLAILDRGADGLEGTADDVLRIYRDRNADGVFDAEDHVLLPLPSADAMRTPLVSTSSGHLLTIETGTDGVPGGADDRIVPLWLRGSLRLP